MKTYRATFDADNLVPDGYANQDVIVVDPLVSMNIDLYHAPPSLTAGPTIDVIENNGDMVADIGSHLGLIGMVTVGFSPQAIDRMTNNGRITANGGAIDIQLGATQSQDGRFIAQNGGTLHFIGVSNGGLVVAENGYLDMTRPVGIGTRGPSQAWGTGASAISLTGSSDVIKIGYQINGVEYDGATSILTVFADGGSQGPHQQVGSFQLTGSYEASEFTWNGNNLIYTADPSSDQADNPVNSNGDTMRTYVAGWDVTNSVPTGFINQDIIDVKPLISMAIGVDPVIANNSMTNNGLMRAEIGSTLTIETTRKGLWINFLINNNGTFSASGGKMEFTGNIAQSNSARIEARNGATVVLDGGANGGTLSVENSTVDFNISSHIGITGAPSNHTTTNIELKGFADILNFGNFDPSYGSLSATFDSAANKLLVYLTTDLGQVTQQAASLQLSGSYSSEDFSIHGTNVIYEDHRIA
jgi:hypothetical protein